MLFSPRRGHGSYPALTARTFPPTLAGAYTPGSLLSSLEQDDFDPAPLCGILPTLAQTPSLFFPSTTYSYIHEGSWFLPPGGSQAPLGTEICLLYTCVTSTPTPNLPLHSIMKLLSTELNGVLLRATSVLLDIIHIDP